VTAHGEPEPTTRIAAYGLVFDDDRRLLLVRIAAGYTRDADGKWTLPGGGLKFGEDPARGAVREIEEETGFSAELGPVAFVSSYVRGAIPSEGVGEFHSVRIVYNARVTGGSLRHEVDESTDMAAWFSLDEVRQLPIVELVHRALEHLEASAVALAN
jgi:8-oxo-dGTP diphosphatase